MSMALDARVTYSTLSILGTLYILSVLNTFNIPGTFGILSILATEARCPMKS